MSDVKLNNNIRVTIPKLEFAGFETGGGWGLGEQFARLPPAEDQLKQNKLVYKVARPTPNAQTLTHSNTRDASSDVNKTDRARERSRSNNDINSSNNDNNNNEHEKKNSTSKRNKGVNKTDNVKIVSNNNNNNKNSINQKNGNKSLHDNVQVLEQTSAAPLQPSRSLERLISSTKQSINRIELEQEKQEENVHFTPENYKITPLDSFRVEEEYPSESMVHETQYNVQAEDDDNTFIDHGSGRVPWYANSLHGKSTPSSSIQGGRSIESTDINLDANKTQTVEQVRLNKHHAMQSVESSNHVAINSTNNTTASANNRWTLLPQESQMVREGQHEFTRIPTTSSHSLEADNLNDNYKKTFVPLIDTTNRIVASPTSIKSNVSNGSSSSEVAQVQINGVAINGKLPFVNKANLYCPLSPDSHHQAHQRLDNNNNEKERKEQEEYKREELEEAIVHENEQPEYQNRKNHKIDKPVQHNNITNDHITVSQVHSSPARTSRNEPQTWLPLHLLSRMTMTNYIRDMAVAPNGQTLFTAVGDDPLAVLELDGADLRVSSVMESVTFVYCMAVVRIPCTHQTTFKLLNERNSYVADKNDSYKDNNNIKSSTTTTTSFLFANANIAAATNNEGNIHKNANVNTNVLQRTNSNNNNNNGSYNNSYNKEIVHNANNVNNSSNNETELVTLTRRGKALRTRKQIARQVSHETTCAINAQSEEHYVLWCGMARGTICVVDLEHNTIDGFIANAHSDTVHKIWYLDNGKVWTSGRDKAIKVWDPQTRRRIKTRHIAAILNDMCYVHCTQQVWGIADDNIIRVYEAEGGNVCLTRSSTETVPNAVKLKSEVNLISCYGTAHEYVWAGMVRNTQLIDPLTYEVATSLNLTLSAITFHDCQAIFVGHGPMVESEVDRIGILDLHMPLQPALMYLGNEIMNASPIGIRLFTTYPLAILAHEVDDTPLSNKLLSIFTYAEMPPIRTSSHYAQEINMAPQRQVNMGRRAVTTAANNNNTTIVATNTNTINVQNQTNNASSDVKMNNYNNNVDEELEPLPESYTKTRIASKAAPAWNGITTATNTITSRSNNYNSHHNHHQPREHNYDAALTNTQNTSANAAANVTNGLPAAALVNTISSLTLLSPQESPSQQQEQQQETQIIRKESKEQLSSESLQVHNAMTSLSPDVLSSIDSIRENAEAMKYMLINLQRTEVPLADFAKLHKTLSSYLLASPELLFALTNEERTNVERQYQTPEGRSMGIAIACLMKRKKNNAKPTTHDVQPFLSEKARPRSPEYSNRVTTNLDNNINKEDDHDEEDTLQPSSRRYTLPLIDNRLASMNAPRKSDKQRNHNTINNIQSSKERTEAVEAESSNNMCSNNNNSSISSNSIRLLSEERAKSAAREEIHKLSQCWHKESEMHHKEVQMLHRYHRQSLERNTALISGIARIQEAIQTHLMEFNERNDRDNNINTECRESVHDSEKRKDKDLKIDTSSTNNTNGDTMNNVQVPNNEGNTKDEKTADETNQNTSEVKSNHVISTRSPSFAHEHSIERTRDMIMSTSSFHSLSTSSPVKEIHSAIDNILRALQILMRDGNKSTVSSLPQSVELRELSETCNDVLMLQSDSNTNCTLSESNGKHENNSQDNCKSADTKVNVTITNNSDDDDDISERPKQEEQNIQDTLSVIFCPVNPLTTPPLQFIYVLQSELNVVYETIPKFSSTWNRVEDLHRVYYGVIGTKNIISSNGSCNDSTHTDKRFNAIQLLQTDFTRCKWLWDVMVAQMMVDVTRHACLLSVISVLTEVSESNLFVATPLQSEVEQNAFYMSEVYNGVPHSKSISQYKENKANAMNGKFLTNSLQIVDGLCVLQPYVSLSDRSRTLQLVDATSASLVEVFLEFESLTTRIQNFLENIEHNSSSSTECTEIANDMATIEELTLSESALAEMYNKDDSSDSKELIVKYNLPKHNFDFMTYLRWVHIAVNAIHHCTLLVEKFVLDNPCSVHEANSEEQNDNNSICNDREHLNDNVESNEQTTNMCKTNECTSSEENNIIIQQKLKQWLLYLQNMESEMLELLTVVSLIINMTNKSLSSISSSLPPLSLLFSESINAGASMSGVNGWCNKTLAKQTNVDAKSMECSSTVSKHDEQITVREVQDSRYADIIFIYLLFIISTHYTADELFFVQENSRAHHSEFANVGMWFEQLCDIARELNVLHHLTSSSLHTLESLIQKVDMTIIEQQQEEQEQEFEEGDELQEERFCEQ